MKCKMVTSPVAAFSVRSGDKLSPTINDAEAMQHE
jgi:hypothetical protein